MTLCLCPAALRRLIVSHFALGLVDRPHPVKPMSSAENQFPSGSPTVKDIRIVDTKAAQITQIKVRPLPPSQAFF